MKPKTLLIVMDGWGINRDYVGNAITRANTPFFDSLWHKYPHCQLEASGLSVGLPEGQMGTSEVNHLTIGAGRVIYQDLVRINQSIEDGSFLALPHLIKAFKLAQIRGSKLHILGLISPGGVHSHQHHISMLVKAAANHGLKHIYIHAFTDGRDTPPTHAPIYLKELEHDLEQIGVGRIVSLVGRYYSMDRDHNWYRTDQAVNLLLQGSGAAYPDVYQALDASYQKGVTDEFVKPAVIGSSPTTIGKNDVVIFANFRNDRPRQLTERLLHQTALKLHLVTMTRYHPEYPVDYLFEPQTVKHSLGEVIAKAKLKQFRITETEKFAHMTFFLNCKREDPFEGEDRFMFDSYSDIKTHDERPAMRAHDIAAHLAQTLEAGTYDALFTNLCNPDMVGHTGNIPAAIKAVEAIDNALKVIIPAALKGGYHTLLTADHGNADEMLSDTGEVITSHSLNPVPVILISKTHTRLNIKNGTLTDIAPTLLNLLKLDIPAEMTGTSFI
jgi:2,3-bisphosphoglycerate-independent phosphoglycerate mutase